MHRSILTALTVALTLSLSPAASAAPLGFGPPAFVDDSRAGGEPVLHTDFRTGRMLYSSHAGTTHLYRPGFASPLGVLQFASTYRNQVFMWSSDDRGKTWQRIEYAGGATTDPSKNQGFSDPDLTEDAGGRIYNTGIDLANQAIFSSADGGRTWDKGTVQCTPGDRPWLAGGRKEEVFMSTDVLTGALSHVVLQSEDGGDSCNQTQIPAAGTLADGTTWTGDGKLLYDRPRDMLVEPAVFTHPDGSHGVGVDFWKRGDATFTPVEVSRDEIYAHWPAIALDDAGSLYLTWDDSPRAEGTAGGCNGDATPTPNHVFLAASKDLGRTWGTRTTLAAPADRRAFWPWVAAGEAGRVSVVWYETDKVVDLACESAKLRVKAASVLHADTATPAVDVADAAGRVIAEGDICQSGTTCAATGEDRRLGDFFTNAVDLDGCAYIGTGDTTRTDPISGQPLPTSRPLVLRQNRGPRLRGTGDCSGAADPGAALGLPSSRTCTSRRAFDIHLRAPRGQKLRSARVVVAGMAVEVRRRGGRLVARVDLSRKTKASYTVRITARTTKGRVVRSTRTYRTCLKRPGT